MPGETQRFLLGVDENGFINSPGVAVLFDIVGLSRDLGVYETKGGAAGGWRFVYEAICLAFAYLRCPAVPHGAVPHLRRPQRGSCHCCAHGGDSERWGSECLARADEARSTGRRYPVSCLWRSHQVAVQHPGLPASGLRQPRTTSGRTSSQREPSPPLLTTARFLPRQHAYSARAVGCDPTAWSRPTTARQRTQVTVHGQGRLPPASRSVERNPLRDHTLPPGLTLGPASCSDLAVR